MPLDTLLTQKENAVQCDDSALLFWVPNRLLFTWYQSNKCAAEYIYPSLMLLF